MKIAVDARPLKPPLKGIGRYTEELLSRIVISEHQWHIYTNFPLNNDYLYRKNVSVHTIPLFGNSNVSAALASQLIYPWWAKTQGIDLFWSPRHHLPLLLSHRIKTVLTIHDLVWVHAKETMPYLSWLQEKWLMPASLKQAQTIITISKSTKEALLQKFPFVTNQLHVISPAAKTTSNRVSTRMMTDPKIETPFFLFIGTIEPRKNLVRLLNAYAALPDRVKDKAHFLIVGGNGWGGIELDAAIASLNLRQHVKVLGYIDEASLAVLYSRASFLVMPSYYEGFGLPLVEAMVHGKPVLTSNLSSMPEVAGNAGLLVDPYDIDSISHGLQQMIENTGLRNKLARNAKTNARRFNWDVSAQQLLKLFEQTLQSKHSA